MAIGKRLNKLWKVGAKHSLYRKNGTWYHLLERFPGALFDADGFIPFGSYEDFKKFRQRPGVTGHGEIAVQGGISSHPDYIRVR